MTLGDAHNCPGEKGPQSPYRPPNVSQDPAGYNTRAFRREEDIAAALHYLGYQSPDGDAMIRRFQRHWNGVISKIALAPRRYSGLTWAYIPEGNLRTDGEIGPHTLNALEIAVMNQRTSGDLAWPAVVEFTSLPDNGYGRQRKYNAAQGM